MVALCEFEIINLYPFFFFCKMRRYSAASASMRFVKDKELILQRAMQVKEKLKRDVSVEEWNNL